MEPTEEVLVVIQAESGEEIALPLAALDEQHQEVVVASGDGSAGVGVIANGGDHHTEIVSFDQTEHARPGDGVQQSPKKSPEVPRQKQKRKEKLVCLPLNEEDLTLVFHVVEKQAPQVPEESRRKPRKEYRTKRKLAALEAAGKEIETRDNIPTKIEPDNQALDASPAHQSYVNHNNSNNNHIVKRRRVTKEDKPIEVAAQQNHVKHEDSDQQQQPHERRTRLSNACRVATGKSYKCNDCDFSTERINNIILHMKETCPKLKSK